MNKALLDTDILSEVLKGIDQSVALAARQYRDNYGFLTTSVVSVMEVVKGFHKVGREKQRKAFVESIAHEEVLAFGFEASEIAGRIYAELERSGQGVGRADPIVAAIAIQSELDLVTGNVGHFERIRKMGYPLRIVNWRESK